ncbi:MAG: hypothetical protein OXF11_22295 [Deltaproteobacteria bacterium]|nr:hypothetical protein [Deltaproteobacteria bacterium]
MPQYEIHSPAGSGKEISGFQRLVLSAIRIRYETPFEEDTVFFEVEDRTTEWPPSARSGTFLTLEGRWNHRTLPKENRIPGKIDLFFNMEDLTSEFRDVLVQIATDSAHGKKPPPTRIVLRKVS